MSRGGFHRLLVNFLGGDEQPDFAAALLKFLRYSNSWKEMPARPAAGDSDEGRFGVGLVHVGRAAKGLSPSSS